MADARPFKTVEHFLCEGEELWFSLPSVDQLEAYGRNAELADVASGTDKHTGESLAAIADLYQEKFGFRLIVNTSRRAPDEVLAIAAARFRNSAETELRLAAEEQARAIQNRLSELLET